MLKQDETVGEAPKTLEERVTQLELELEELRVKLPSRLVQDSPDHLKSFVSSVLLEDRSGVRVTAGLDKLNELGDEPFDHSSVISKPEEDTQQRADHIEPTN